MSAESKMTRLEELKAALTEPAATILAAQEYAGDEVSAKTKAAYGRMVDAHLLIRGVIGGMLIRTEGKRTEHGDVVQERRVLFASFVVGMPLCEQAIEEGRYIQALTLLRHEMETLAQVVSSHLGKRVHGKAAKISVLRKDISRMHGTLSAAAHSAKHPMASELLTRGHESEYRISTGTYFYPVLNETLSRRAFAFHLILTIDLICQMAIDYQLTHPAEGVGPLDQEAVNVALRLLEEEGMVEIDEGRDIA
jgi:hypothetical protein